MNRSKTIILLAFSSFFYTCNRNTATTDSDSANNDTGQVQVEKPAINLEPIYEYDDEKSMVIKKREAAAAELQPENIISILNQANDKVKIAYVKTGHDTVFVRINESMYLTQQMGTTGADAYMMTAVYSFTELKGIKHVHFDFEEGDHAAPGTYSRDYYIDRN